MYGLGCNISETTYEDVDAHAEIMTAVFLRYTERKKYL